MASFAINPRQDDKTTTGSKKHGPMTTQPINVSPLRFFRLHKKKCHISRLFGPIRLLETLEYH